MSSYAPTSVSLAPSLKEWARKNGICFSTLLNAALHMLQMTGVKVKGRQITDYVAALMEAARRLGACKQ